MTKEESLLNVSIRNPNNKRESPLLSLQGSWWTKRDEIEQATCFLPLWKKECHGQFDKTDISGVR